MHTMEPFKNVDIKHENQEWVFVDIQGYKVNKNRFMCKEFCLVDGDETFHAIVKSWFPYKKLLGHYKRHIAWLTNYFHGLNYECGNIHMDELKKIVYPKLVGKVVIVKGREKTEWIQYMFRKYGPIACENIENFDYDMSEYSSHQFSACEFHKERFGWMQSHCAMKNAYKLQDISNANAPIRFF